MKKKKKTLKELFYEVMEEIYNASIPRASFKELTESSPRDEAGRAMIPFEEYRIPESLLDDIVERFCKTNHLSPFDATRLRTNVYLGPSPCGIQESSKNDESAPPSPR